VGWGVIPLDAKPGSAGYALSATRDGGASLSISGELQVEAKSFPEQRWDVASKYVNPPKAAAKRIAREQATLGKVYARRTPLAPAGAPFVRPVPGEPTSEFGTRRVFNGEPRSPHPGLDLRAATGTPVLAAGPGTIVLAADLYYSGGTVIRGSRWRVVHDLRSPLEDRGEGRRHRPRRGAGRIVRRHRPA
jgi:murein DD-endopeptidase MepM/ murein hydrolase activator NlpD